MPATRHSNKKTQKQPKGSKNTPLAPALAHVPDILKECDAIMEKIQAELNDAVQDAANARNDATEVEYIQSNILETGHSKFSVAVATAKEEAETALLLADTEISNATVMWSKLNDTAVDAITAAVAAATRADTRVETLQAALMAVETDYLNKQQELEDAKEDAKVEAERLRTAKIAVAVANVLGPPQKSIEATPQTPKETPIEALPVDMQEAVLQAQGDNGTLSARVAMETFNGVVSASGFVATAVLDGAMAAATAINNERKRRADAALENGRKRRAEAALGNERKHPRVGQ